MMTSYANKLREWTLFEDAHPNNLRRVIDEAADEIESLTAERDRLAKALELAANRLYEEGAPHSFVDDAREVLAGRDPY